MNPDPLALGATVSAIANLAMVGILTCAGAIIHRLRRRLRVQAEVAIDQALDLAWVRDALDEAMADNDRLALINDGLAKTDCGLAVAELGRLIKENDELRDENVRLLGDWVGEAS